MLKEIWRGKFWEYDYNIERQTNGSRQKTKVIDIAERVARQKWKWADHLIRVDNNRWTKKTTDWRPRTTKRNTGRPRTR